MIKFVVQHVHGETIIHEVNCEKVFTYPFETAKYRILSDAFKEKDGTYPEWVSWAIFDSEGEARTDALRDIRNSMKLWDDKGKEKYDEQELLRKFAAIKVKRLENK